VNTRRPPDRLDTPDFVFQPEIRVRLSHTLRLVPVRRDAARDIEDIPGADDDRNLELLYANRAGLARGHMCSAVWSDVDPQRRPAGPNITVPPAPPFYWVDQESLPAQERHKFLSPDVRSELLPLYSVTAPDSNWSPRWGEAPTLDADRLAETWNGEALRADLSRLCSAYDAWIETQETLATGMGPSERAIALANIAQCREAAVRMRSGVQRLVDDEDARLAFSFANKAMALQARWARGRPLLWKPFQLGFLLLSIPGICDPQHADRDVCDLIWFPTGGGKNFARQNRTFDFGS
jgi:hypothetical protein